MSETKVLFRFSGDEFVNEAVAELAKESGLDDEKITPTKIYGTEEDLNKIFTKIKQLMKNTHRRTTDVRYVNYHTDNSIASSDKPFPDGEDIASDGEITMQYLENHGISTDNFPNSSASIYSKSPYFTGAAAKHNWSTDRFERYKSIMMNVLFGDENGEVEHACKNCSRKDLPNWKYDGEDIDYNQKFTPYITKSGATALGQKGSLDSSQRGRCVACLVAGFAYSFIPKPFYTKSPGEYRIYTFKSDFEGLHSVRYHLTEKSEMISDMGSGNILEPIDTDSKPDNAKYRKTLPSNLPANTNADKGQLLSLLSRLNKATYTLEYHGDKYGSDGAELSQNVKGATVYTTSSSKGGHPVRGNTNIISHSFDNRSNPNIQSVIYIDKFTDEEKRFYPHQFIEMLSQIQQSSKELNFYTQQVNRIADGILYENISNIESGLYELAKRIINQKASAPKAIDLYGTNKYLKTVFDNMTELTENDIEALTEVGSNLGQIFDTRDDVSVLIGLRNANQPHQMLQEMEKAGMEGLKKTTVRDEKVARYNAVREDDLETVLKLLVDRDTFDDAKSVLISHASFASMYSNSVTNNNKGD